MDATKLKTGDKIGRYTVVSQAEPKYYTGGDGRTRRYGRCVVRCDCGQLITISEFQIKNRSAGPCAFHRGSVSNRHHGTNLQRYGPLYTVWAGIKTRCNNSKSKDFALYGARGIKICDEWSDDYLLFADWCASNGYARGLQIDRIDNDGDYSPGNCRFVEPKINARNTRRCRLCASDIPAIKSMFASGAKCGKIAKIYSVSYGAIYAVVKGRTWKD